MAVSKEEKALQNFNLLNKWLYLKNVNIPLKSYLEENGWKNVAVYGLGDVGKRFIEDLQNDGIDIEYAIDAKAVIYFCDFDIYMPSDDLPDVDVIIVTVLYDYINIKEKMPDKWKDKCVSLETIVNTLWERCWIH